MRVALDGLQAAAKSTDGAIDSFLYMEWHYSDILNGFSRRKRFLRLIPTYRSQTERYFRRYLSAKVKYDEELDLHRLLLKCCEARDPDGADRAVGLLFKSTVDKLLPELLKDIKTTRTARTS
jgi:DNA-binding GntR family transcriptional regulator